MEGRLTRSRHDVMIACVCSGFARWANLDPTVVRVVFALVSFFSSAFPGILVYVILWLIIPEDPDH